jgi:hypothetical protein
MRIFEMTNPYVSMLPQPAAEDTREAVKALSLFAEALQQYAGQNKDVEVSISVDSEGGADNVAEVQMSVFVPKTDYVNIVLVARCQGQEGFPVTIDPYFAGTTFSNGVLSCSNRTELDAALKRFVESPEILSLLDYMKRHAQEK